MPAPRPLRPTRAPTHRPALAVGELDRAAGVPRAAQAAAAAALLAAEPAPAMARGTRKAEEGGGLGSLTVGARLSAPPLLSFMFFSFNYSAGNS